MTAPATSTILSDLLPGDVIRFHTERARSEREGVVVAAGAGGVRVDVAGFEHALTGKDWFTLIYRPLSAAEVGPRLTARIAEISTRQRFGHAATEMHSTREASVAADRLALRALPESIEAAEERILENRTLMQAGAVDTARVIAHVRALFFKRDVPGWLAWCRDRFDIQRRQAFRCLSVGRLLIAATHEEMARRLAAVDLEKLEMVASLPWNQQRGFAERVDLAATSRDDLRRKVALWRVSSAGERGAKDAGAGQADTKSDRRLREFPASQRLIERVALLGEADKLAIGSHIEPAEPLRAIEFCFGVALCQCEHGSRARAALYDQFLAHVRDYTDRLTALLVSNAPPPVPPGVAAEHATRSMEVPA